MRLPPRPAGSQETSSAQSGGREPAGAPGDPLPPARAPRGRRIPGRRDVTPPTCQLRATPGPPPGHPKAIPDQPWATLRPPTDHSHPSPGPSPGHLLGHLRAVSRPRAGMSVRCRPPPRSHPAAQGAGDARCQALAQRGGPAGSLTEAPRRRAAPGLGRRRPTARLSHCSGAAAGGGRASPRAGAPNPGVPRPPRPGARPRHTPAPPPRLFFCPSESFRDQVCGLLKSGDLVAVNSPAAAGRALGGPHAAAGPAGSRGRSRGIAHPHFSRRAAAGGGRTRVFNR